ncbi:MAG: transporter [Magnetococcales bacterium]|nr:transporter [Magnetococcales bacterium]
MKRSFSGFCAIAIVGVFIGAGAAHSGEQGHYVHGVEGLKAASVPPPGYYVRWYNALYTANKLADQNGDASNVGLDLEVFATVPRFVWITNKKILGADYGMNLIVPFINTDIQITAAGVNQQSFAMGDIFVEPLLLAWHGKQWDAAFGLGWNLPIGEYSTADSSSAGKDFYTTMFSFGGTWYPDAKKEWSVTMLNRYEIHSKKDQTDAKLGDDYHFEWAVGKKVSPTWELGLAGYAQWQVNDDEGSAITYDKTVHDQVFAVGPEASVFIPQLTTFVSLRSLWEFGAVDRSEGNITVLTFTKPF